MKFQMDQSSENKTVAMPRIGDKAPLMYTKLKFYALTFLWLSFFLASSATSGLCKGSMLTVSAGPAFLDIYRIGEALALSMNYTKMQRSDTRGFTLTTILYGFCGPPDDWPVSNDWLFIFGPGYLLRNPPDKKIGVFLHPCIGIGFLKRTKSYTEPYSGHRHITGDTESLLVLSVAAGWQYRMKDNLDLILQIRPAHYSQWIFFGSMGIEFSGGLNFYF